MQEMWPWIVLAALLAAWFALTQVGKISGAKARELVAAGAQLIDVRTEAEFALGHLPNATHVALDKLRARAPALAREGKTLVVYCHSGMRGASAKRVLRAAGASHVYDLGAMSRW
jgi:phage shock protein E